MSEWEWRQEWGSIMMWLRAVSDIRPHDAARAARYMEYTADRMYTLALMLRGK